MVNWWISWNFHQQKLWISWVLLVFSHVNIFFYRGFTGINSEITVYIYIYIYIYHQQQYGLTWVDDVERHIWIHGSVFFGVIEYWRWIESKDWNPGFGISDCSWGNTPCLPIVAICKESHISNFWLVVWNIILFFHILGIIIPTDFHIFQRGFRNHQPANLFA